MNIEDKIKKSMARMIEREKGDTNVQVTSYSEEYDKESYGGCETCGPSYEETYEVHISYSSDNKSYRYGQYYIYRGKFTDLIKELDTE